MWHKKQSWPQEATDLGICPSTLPSFPNFTLLGWRVSTLVFFYQPWLHRKKINSTNVIHHPLLSPCREEKESVCLLVGAFFAPCVSSIYLPMTLRNWATVPFICSRNSLKPFLHICSCWGKMCGRCYLAVKSKCQESEFQITMLDFRFQMSIRTLC